MIDDLVTWLRAQLDEDERVAQSCEHRSWARDGASIVGAHPTDQVVDWVYDEGGWDHIARHDPARVLAEVDAKRRILGQYVLDHDADGQAFVVGGYGEAWLDTLRLLALPYADRPGYRHEWAPDAPA